MKNIIRFVCFCMLTMFFGCSSAEQEQCIDLDKISDERLGNLIGDELLKIYSDEKHFHRRTGEPEDYEIIDFDHETEPPE